MALHRNPRERLDSIERHLDRETVDDDLKAEVEAELPGVYREFVSLQSDMAFDQHLAKYVTEQKKARERGHRDPLCSCSLPSCPLTQGRIPPKVRYTADSVMPQAGGRKRVLEYLQNHNGGEVLHEALETWDEREGQLHRDISRLHNKVVTNATENQLREVPQEA